MKSYWPYSPSTPSMIYGEVHVIQNGQILLNHIPYANSIEISGFSQTSSVSLSPGQFYCAYGSEYYYREANCIVKFNAQHNGETVSVDYLQVGTIITANDMNEIKAHIEDNSIHNRYELPAATTETRGGIRVGQGLSILGDILSADAQDYTLPSATVTKLGGVVVESDANIARTIERYFPSTGETLPVHVQEIATRESLGSVKIGAGLSITEDGLLTADAQDFTLTPASRDSLGGVKIGSGLSIDASGVLSADTVEPYMLPIATRDSLGGVKIGNSLTIIDGTLNYSLPAATNARTGGVVVESDENISRTIERYFPSVTADTEIIPVLTSIPVATIETLGGVKIGDGLSITEDGILSADAQNFTLTPATADSLGGVKIGDGLSITGGGVLSALAQDFTLKPATNDSLGGVFVESDENISRTIQRYFPTVGADEIIPVLTSIPPATRESIGGVIVGDGLTITENGLLTADAQNFTLTPATTDSLGGVMFLTDEDVEAMLESYFGAGATDTGSPTIIGGSSYILPIATAEKLGGVKIGSGLSINANGILSADAQNYTLPAASSTTRGGIKIGSGLTMTGDTLNADAQNFTLTAATTDSLGGVKIVDDSIIAAMLEEYFPTVSGEAIAPLYSIPAATADSLGGIKVGDGLSITTDGLLSALAQNFTLTPATNNLLGGVKIGDGLSITTDGLLTADAQDFTLKPATTSQLGGVKIGARLSITEDGILSADSVAPYTLPAASDEEISSMIEEHFPETLTPEPFTLPAATKYSLGGVIPGVTMSIEDGVIDYYLPTASSNQLGGVKVGNTLSMSSNGVLNYNLPNATSAALGGVIAGNTLTISNGTLNYNLPTASASQLGGVKIGDGLTITNGVLSANSNSATLPVASDEEISAIIQNYFAYTVVGGA